MYGLSTLSSNAGFRIRKEISRATRQGEEGDTEAKNSRIERWRTRSERTGGQGEGAAQIDVPTGRREVRSREAIQSSASWSKSIQFWGEYIIYMYLCICLSLHLSYSCINTAALLPMTSIRSDELRRPINVIQDYGIGRILFYLILSVQSIVWIIPTTFVRWTGHAMQCTRSNILAVLL